MPPCFCSMTPPTTISDFISNQPYLSMLQTTSTTMKDLKKIHAQLIKTGLIKDHIAASRLLAFCISPSGDINYAHSLFNHIETKNPFIWNTIIRGFSQSSTPRNSILLLIDMLNSPIEPQRLTYPSVFKAYAQLGLEGGQLHGRIIKLGLGSDRYIRNTILYMYANCGMLSEARKVFDKAENFDVVAWNVMIMGLAKFGEIDESRRLFDNMMLKNIVSWSSMISGYARKGKFGEALKLFRRMQEEGLRPNEHILVSLLNSCACLGALEQGEWIHDYVKTNFDLNPIIVTSIVDMYAKCGSIDKALQVFDAAETKALSCWNSMILGLATNGYSNKAIELFSLLESSSSLVPDDVSFIGVLVACKHAGFVKQAKDYFLSMMETYNIEPSVKHYSCMVDVLGGAGLLGEAEELILSMPAKPDAIIWGSLLSSCKKHGNVEMAKRAAKNVIELDKGESSSLVAMSNVYAGCGQFEEAVEQRFPLKERTMEKLPGCSSIEVNGEVHEFVAGGRLHPETEQIYNVVNDFT